MDAGHTVDILSPSQTDAMNGWRSSGVTQLILDSTSGLGSDRLQPIESPRPGSSCSSEAHLDPAAIRHDQVIG